MRGGSTVYTVLYHISPVMCPVLPCFVAEDPGAGISVSDGVQSGLGSACSLPVPKYSSLFL